MTNYAMKHFYTWMFEYQLPNTIKPYREIVFPEDILVLNTSGTMHICGYYPRIDGAMASSKQHPNILEVIEKFPNGFPTGFSALYKDNDEDV